MFVKPSRFRVWYLAKDWSTAIVTKQELFHGCERLGFSVNSGCSTMARTLPNASNSWNAFCHSCVLFSFFNYMYFIEECPVRLLRICWGRLVLFVLSERLRARVHTKRKRKFSSMFVAYSLIFLYCSLSFFFYCRFRLVWIGLKTGCVDQNYLRLCILIFKIFVYQEINANSYRRHEWNVYKGNADLIAPWKLDGNMRKGNQTSTL